MVLDSRVNVRLSAVRKLVAEARRNGLIGVEDAASLSEVPNIRQKGNSAGELADTGSSEGAACRSRSLDAERQAGLCNSGAAGWLCASAAGAGDPRRGDNPATRRSLGPGRSRREGKSMRTVAVPVWVKQVNDNLGL